MGDEKDSDPDRLTDLSDVSRRKLLSMSSAAVAAGVAGCGGDGGGDGDDDTTEPSGDGDGDMDGDGDSDGDSDGDDTTTEPSGDGDGDTDGDGDSDGDDDTQTEAENTTRPRQENISADANVPAKARTFEPLFDGEARRPTINIIGPGNRSNPQELNLWHLNEAGTGTTVNGQHRHHWWADLVAWGYGPNPPMEGANNIEWMDNGCVIEVELDPEWTYTDGTPVTTDSVQMAHEIRAIRENSDPGALDAMGDEYGSPLSLGSNATLEVVDDKTFRFNYASPKNTWDLGVREMRGRIGTQFKPSVYTDVHEQYLDATTADEVDSITESSWETTIDIQEAVDRGITNGLWVPDPDDMSSTHLVVHKRDEGHPFAQSTNLESARFEYVPDRSQRVELYKQGEFDHVPFGDLGAFDVGEADSLDIRNEFTFNCIIGGKFHFDGPGGHRPVRQAIAALIDTNEFQSLAETNGLPAGLARFQAGADSVTLPRWVGEDFMNENFIDYATEAKPEMARQILNDAGWSEQGGEWIKPDGEPLEQLTYVARTSRKLQLSTQYITGEMEDFNLPVETQFVDDTTWDQEYIFGEENWDITSSWACGGYPSKVFFGGRMSSISDWAGDGRNEEYVMDQDYSPPTAEECQPLDYEQPPLERDTTPILGHPARPDMPAFGEGPNSDDRSQTLTPFVNNWELGQASSNEKVRELAREFAWYANWQMTQVACYDEITQITTNSTDFQWAHEDWPGYWNHRSGNWNAMGLVEGRPPE